MQELRGVVSEKLDMRGQEEMEIRVFSIKILDSRWPEGVHQFFCSKGALTQNRLRDS